MTRPTIEHFKKLSVMKLSKDFRSAVQVVDSSLPAEVPDGHVYIRVFYVGVNATDINVTNGAYNKGATPPFDCGLEAVGVVEQIAPDVTSLAVNDHVLCFTRNAYTEMLSAPASFCVKLPSADPEFIVLAASALTASIALGEVGKPQKGEVALVTAAAGGTGQIAVQLLKHVYHCTVIGTCSTEDKAAFLKEIGCDYTINYKTDNMDERLTHYAPHGVNLIYECVGGEVYSTALNHIAVGGRMVIIGAISSYKSGKEIPFHNPEGESLQLFLIHRSATLHGFFLGTYQDKYTEYMEKMLENVKENKVKLIIDKTKSFFGLDSIADAIDYMYAGKNAGKVVVKIQE